MLKNYLTEHYQFFLDKTTVIKYLCWSLLIVLVIGYFILINDMVKSSLPYPTHVDEYHRLVKAADILKTGEFETGYFHKPTFPIYLTAVGLSAGFILSAKQGKIRKTKEIGSVSYPYYDHPEIIKVAKQLFVIFSAMAILLISYAAYKAFQVPYLLFLPALLIPFSSVYTSKSYKYINSNILGAFFIALSLSYIFYNLKKTGAIKKALIPGILCAMVISSKYNYLGIYLPFMLAILFYEPSHMISRTILLISVSVVTILILNPYFILNLPEFLNDTAYQVNHYMQRGHKGYEGKPGLSQFIYYMNSMIEQFGITAFVFSIIGLGYMFRINYKKALIFISFPLFLLVLMSASKANFLRNLTPVYMLWPVFISMGFVAYYRTISVIFDYNMGVSRQVQKAVAGFVPIALLLLTLPFAALSELMEAQQDSRKQVSQWLLRQDDVKMVVIPNDLSMDTRQLSRQLNIISISRKQLNFDYFNEFLFKESYYYLLPVYGVDTRFPKRKKLEKMQLQMRRLIESNQLQAVKIFGKNKVLLNYQKTVAKGNPKLYLAKYSKQNVSTKD